MKGIYIYEAESRIGTEVDCLEIGNIDHTFTQQIDSGTLSEEVEMHALVSKGTKTKCSPDDTYDFETGALIALMKMCGVEKVVRACNEAFPKEMYNTYITKFEGELHELKKENNILREANKGLQEEVKCLKGESENHWKKYQRNIQKKQDRINELEKAYKASNDDEAKLVEYYQCEIKKFEAENKELKKNIDELFESEQHSKSELGRLYFEKHRLEEQVEKLKLDCEKLQHGYNDMIFCGGRRSGKQYTALVNMFKKIDQKKVDAAYKEAYNTELPVWQKEFFKQMYDITVYRKHPPTVDGFIIKTKPLTNREEMWGKILGDRKYGESLGVKVEKAFIDDFLSEAEDNGLVWANGGEKPTEWDKWESWRRHDYTVFTIWYRGKIKELTWGYPSDEKTINYLPPMRWDLFKKGRIFVGVRRDQYNDFRDEITRQFGLTNQHKPYEDFNYTFYMYDKKANFIEALGRSQFREIKTINGHKVVYWEDVRDVASTTEDPYDTWKW